MSNNLIYTDHKQTSLNTETVVIISIKEGK